MKNKITCIITDDEPFARKGLQGYAEKTPFIEVIGVCEDGLQLSELLSHARPDVLFLDIEMPHLTGIELVRTLPNAPKVIFTTAYEQYAIQGYELDVLDYLLKPISYERFLKAAYKALDYFSYRDIEPGAASHIFVKADGRLEKIVFDDILYIEGMENYIAIYTIQGRVITHSSIKAFVEKLPPKKFIQTHKSFIAAIDKITSIEGNMLNIGKAQVAIGRTLREWVLAQIVNK